MHRLRATHVPFSLVTSLCLVALLILMTCSAFGQVSNPGGNQKQLVKAQCDGLVGTWRGPESTIELSKDGTTVVNGIKYRYTVEANVIVLVGSDGTFRFPYKLQGDVLNVLVNGALQTYKCVAPGTTEPQRGNGELSEEILLSSAWCTFSYNKITSYSNSTKWVFNPDGTFSKGGRAEGYSSGGGGSMASQHDSRSGGRWKLVDGELYLSQGQGVPQPVLSVLKRNNQGYPIIVANGVEYSQCK